MSVFTITKNGNGRGADYSKYQLNQLIGGKNQPWYNNRKYIKTVNVEEGVVQIGSYWFYDCTNLTTVNFPPAFGKNTALPPPFPHLLTKRFWSAKTLLKPC